MVYNGAVDPDAELKKKLNLNTTAIAFLAVLLLIFIILAGLAGQGKLGN